MSRFENKLFFLSPLLSAAEFCFFVLSAAEGRCAAAGQLPYIKGRLFHVRRSLALGIRAEWDGQPVVPWSYRDKEDLD